MLNAIYPGSFDPPTRGHLWMIKEALALCETLTIAVGNNPLKTPYFTAEARREMIETLLNNELEDARARITVTTFADQYLVRHAKEMAANVLIRGMRSAADFMHERKLQRMNARIDNSLRTVYLVPPEDIAEISSSTVRALVGYEGWEAVIKPYVPESLHAHLVHHFTA